MVRRIDRKWFFKEVFFRLKIYWGDIEGLVGIKFMKELKECLFREEW